MRNMMTFADTINFTTTAHVGAPNSTDNALDKQEARALVIILLAFLAFLSNVFLLLAIVPNSRFYTMNNVILCHLAGLGLVHALLILPAGVSAALGASYVNNEYFCQVQGFVTWLWTLVSIWTVTSLGLDKYYTVASPLAHTTTATRRKLLMWFTPMWVVSSCISILPLLQEDRPFIYSRVHTSCVANNNLPHITFCIVIFVVFAFYIPCLVLIYCYSHIFRITRSRSRRIGNISDLVTFSMHIPINIKHLHTMMHTSSQNAFRGRKALWTIFHFLFSFVMSYVPVTVLITLEAVTAHHVPQQYAIVAVTLFQSSTCVNAFIYGVSNSLLRESFGSFIRRKIQKYSSVFRHRLTPASPTYIDSQIKQNPHSHVRPVIYDGSHIKQVSKGHIPRPSKTPSARWHQEHNTGPSPQIFHIRSRSLDFEPMGGTSYVDLQYKTTGLGRSDVVTIAVPTRVWEESRAHLGAGAPARPYCLRPPDLGTILSSRGQEEGCAVEDVL